jgi:hypothetical protein
MLLSIELDPESGWVYLETVGGGDTNVVRTPLTWRPNPSPTSVFECHHTTILTTTHTFDVHGQDEQLPPLVHVSQRRLLPTQPPFHIQLELGERQTTLQALGRYATRGSWQAAERTGDGEVQIYRLICLVRPIQFSCHGGWASGHKGYESGLLFLKGDSTNTEFEIDMSFALPRASSCIGTSSISSRTITRIIAQCQSHTSSFAPSNRLTLILFVLLFAN